MDDFNALASALGTGLSDIRGCLILSRDGLVLGADPAEGEPAAKAAWLRLAALGEPERGFVQFGTEVWCYVRRGPYAAFALTGVGVRPGLVIDHMEQVLLAAEEARGKGLKVDLPAAAQPAAPAPASKPRTTLHPEPKPQTDEPVVIHTDAPAPAAAAKAKAGAADPGTGEGPAPEGSADAPGEPRSSVWGESESEADVDRFSLAREFSQLLQDDEDGADG
jgi:hypothetical protein